MLDDATTDADLRVPADFLANARKGKLAAPTAVTLSSCRRVRTRCSFFHGLLMGKVIPIPQAHDRSNL
jgi:hypothetical protein